MLTGLGSLVGTSGASLCQRDGNIQEGLRVMVASRVPCMHAGVLGDLRIGLWAIASP